MISKSNEKPKFFILVNANCRFKSIFNFVSLLKIYRKIKKVKLSIIILRESGTHYRISFNLKNSNKKALLKQPPTFP